MHTNTPVIFFSHRTLEDWDFSNPDSVGIGGSETSHIELSWRLAARGHKVLSYAPTSYPGPVMHKGVEWRNCELCDFTREGIWFIYRCPEILDKFPENHPNQVLIFVAQDTFYPGATVERFDKLDHYMCLCSDHARATAIEWPTLKDKIFTSANGLKPEKVQEALAKNITRNPYRLMYASSPDRGLKNLSLVFTRAREYVPDLELHVYYGFDNMDKIINGKDPKRAYVVKRAKDDLMKSLDKPGITFHGRTAQPQLYEEWCKAGLWVHPTSFSETGAITSMEAMALGAIPVTNPIWALKDNVQYGVLIDGNPDSDLLVRSRYVGEIIRLTSDVGGTALQSVIRSEMMGYAISKFSWEVPTHQLSEMINKFSTEEEVAYVNG